MTNRDKDRWATCRDIIIALASLLLVFMAVSWIIVSPRCSGGYIAHQPEGVE